MTKKNIYEGHSNISQAVYNLDKLSAKTWTNWESLANVISILKFFAGTSILSTKCAFAIVSTLLYRNSANSALKEQLF